MTTPRTPTIKVLAITGWCRNGSTLIGNLLNEVDGFCHVGELHFLWKNAYGHGTNTRCGCGRDLVRCPVWSNVLAAELPAGATPEPHAEAVRRRQREFLRTRHTWRVLRDGLGTTALRDHAATMARTYRAIAEATGARVIVDSTKLPGEAALLPGVEGIEPLYLHLVRDPRAVAHSWSRQKDYIHRMTPARSTAYWLGFNLASRAVVKRHAARSIVLRYEDFIAEPAAAIRSLIELCGGDPADNPVRGRAAVLRENHTVTGNPDRFHTGATEIRAFDGAWQAELSALDKLATLALSWPLLGRYGYALRGARQAGTADTAHPTRAPTIDGATEPHHGSRSRA